jgi:hypothetical protein
MDHTQQIDQYLAGPDLVRKAVKGMTRQQLLARPIPGKWSTLEVVCHLVDFDPIYADRMKRVIAENRPTLIGADQDRFASRLAYQDRDLEEELAILEMTRRQMGRILKSLSPSDFDRVGLHNELGQRTLLQLLSTISNHIPHHVQFIEEKRKALRIS